MCLVLIAVVGTAVMQCMSEGLSFLGGTVKSFLVMLLCLLLASVDAVDARPLQFRGQFVETYIAADGFLESLPKGVELACEDGLCSFSRSVRIYVFENNGRRESFWSTDYCDVMFDEAEEILACGDSGHLVYHDETNQLLLRHSGCPEQEQLQEEANALFGLPSVAAVF